ncbi:MAG TPA: hypothetical protein VMJ66_05480 [Geobacteraceae bacterium]|nr:hypothetical protein [Geobacteraceae bacterium]
MPEILIITHEQRVLEIADDLRPRLDLAVDIVNDFSQGLKEIFFRRPAVVFIQNEIDGISGEKVAGQVRMFLEGEPIRLVILHSETGGWRSDDSNFDAGIDITLPSEELVGHIRRQVREALDNGPEPSADLPRPPQEVTDTVELIVEPPTTADVYKIDNLADVFPSTPFDDWNTAATVNTHACDAAEQAGQAGAMDGSLAEPGSGTSGEDAAAAPADEPSAPAPSEADIPEVPLPGDVPPTLSPSAAVEKETVLPESGLSAPATTRTKHFEAYSADREWDDDMPFRYESPKRSGLFFRVLTGLLMTAILIMALYLVREWLGLGGGETAQVTPPAAPVTRSAAPVTRPAAPVTAPPSVLPAFIPMVSPDTTYSANHPGWERRVADGMEYLLFRENGRIRAIQVVAGTHGLISDPFLKTCIREASGQEEGINWVREKRDDFVVEKGTLVNKGEVAVYRKMPENEVRGFVITFQ